jgi:hypothetical protein
MRLRSPALLLATLLVAPAASVDAQAAVEGEVRQLVTFRFLPGRLGDATTVFTERALPLYEADDDMLSMRALREVESPVPLDMVVIRSFVGMTGMDRSNASLGRIAAERGTSMSAIYAEISELTVSHDDQFVEMLPELSTGDPAAHRLVALVWYRTLAGEQDRFERTLADVVEWERASGIDATTGRFLVSDGWTHLRFLGFDSLGAYHEYRSSVADTGGQIYLSGVVAKRREVILAPVPELAVR